MPQPDLIPFNVPYVAGDESNYLRQSVEARRLSGDGPFTARATERLSHLLGDAKVLLTTSCTHALEMSALLLDLKVGDEVIMPSFTFVSTANAFALRGAVPVFVDVRPDTLNLDEVLVEAAVTDRTRAIVVVHYGGVACEMEAIMKIAERYGLAVVEDNAHGLGGSYRGRPLGSFGAIATQSFHETKNIHCGEGGALVLNDSRLAGRAEVLREKGTNRSQFFRGMVDKYTWIDLGSSYLPSDMLAAFLLAQLESFDDIQMQRQAIWARYDSELRDWADRVGVVTPTVPDGCVHPAHLFYLLLPDLEAQQGFILHLRRHGVMGVFHYLPLDSSPAGRALGRVAGECPVTHDVAQRLVRLPLYAGLSQSQVSRVVDAVTSFTL